MANKNGHWYTDKQGNHYFVEDGQSPKEGWEASKQRKMISGGKYQVSDDGNEYREVDMDEYNKYEADESDFDESNDDDFGFDEYNEEDDIIQELKDNDVDLDSQAEIREYLGATLGWDREDQMEFVRNLGFTPFEEEEDDEYNREMEKAQEENAMMSEGEDGSELLTENDMNQIKKYAERYEVPLDGLKQVIEEETQKLIDKGASVTNAKNDAMESVLDDVVSRGNLEEFLKNGAKGNPYDPEDLPDEGMSQEELSSSKPSSVGNRLKFKLPNQEEQTGTIESVNENGINAFGKKQKLYTVRTPDGRRIEVNSDYVINPEYPGGMGDYVYDEQNPVDYPDKKHRPTPNQRKAEMADRSAKANRVQHAVDKAKQLKQEGKSNEIMNLLRGLDDDTASAVIEALIGK